MEQTQSDRMSDDVLERSVRALDKLEVLAGRIEDRKFSQADVQAISALNTLILCTTRVARNIALSQRIANVELENEKLRKDIETLAQKFHDEMLRREEHGKLPDSKY